MEQTKMKRGGLNLLLVGGMIAGTLGFMNAKVKDGVIMKVDGEDIPTEEFLYLYEKNNQQLSEPLSIDDYLQLFEVYRLKVAEAKQEGVDTMANFQKEISQYRRELLEPYVTDTVFFNQLVDIAIEREKKDVESSHIMIIRTHDHATDSINLAKLDSIRTELLNGADFITLAKQYSQDRFSSQKGGYLGFNPAGTFPYGFETAVYETPEGEISEIVESHVGWHLVKSGARKDRDTIARPMKTPAEIRADVERKSQSPFDNRYHDIRKHRLNLMKGRHPELASIFNNMKDEEAYEYLYGMEEESQYQINPEYRNLVDEYTNGSLLFEVVVKNVWNKAAEDEENLAAYYANNAQNYKWEKPHAKGILVQAKNDSIAQDIKNKIEGMNGGDVITFVRNGYKKQAYADYFNVTEGINPHIDNIMFGRNETVPEKNYQVAFVIEGRIIDEPEELNDVRSAVVSDYQESLEQQWVGELKAKHTVEINEKELKKLRKQLK